MSSFGVVRRNRDFRRLFAAELVVFGSDWFVMVPLLVLLPELTGSGVWGALVLAADTGIIALLLPYTGTIADRYDRRKIMMVSNLAAIAAVALLFLVRSAATAPLALVAVGAIAVAKAFYSPAASAALPNVVDDEDLAAANAISGSSWGTMTIVGASLGGVVSSAFGPYVSFGVTVVCLLLGAFATALIRRPLQAPRSSGDHPRTWQALAESFRYIAARPRIRALVTVKSAVGLGNGVLTVFPLLAGIFGVGALGAGLLFAMRGAGALIGPLVMGPVLRRRSWLLPGLALSMGLYGVGYLGVALANWFWLVLVLVFVAHFAGGTNWVLSNYALMGEVPDRLRGRVFATDMMLATLAIAVSQLGAAAVVDHVSERAILAGCGLITLIYAVGWRIATRRLSLTGPVAAPETPGRPPAG
ncbi:MFS transporter [Actinoplanes sp. NBRC 103695]|uniref:MFS transporter n=1 Tax=Actinoplanes sp. NBRC 103695 TaxID=3032202 RepID=UPI00249FA07A|nr:MFS transporter [Actinoplanes sp. NBRC 103695]GLY99673.1 MFS transporter [Actinoplanes sp. NBRC 103695]